MGRVFQNLTKSAHVIIERSLSSFQLWLTLLGSLWSQLREHRNIKPAENTIPGWHERIKPYQNAARFWHSLWESAGMPRQSTVPWIDHDLFNNMKISKNQYHCTVRRTQASLNKIENDKVVLKIDSQEMFEEIKKACKHIISI